MSAFEEAIELSEKAIAIAPNSAENLDIASAIMCKSGNPARGLELSKKAIRVCPLYRPGYLRGLAMAYRLLGQLDAAVAAYREAIRREPEYLTAHVNLVSILGELGRLDEANEAAREIFKLEPNFSIKAYMEGLSYRNPSDLARIEEGLQKTGLPE